MPLLPIYQIFAKNALKLPKKRLFGHFDKWPTLDFRKSIRDSTPGYPPSKSIPDKYDNLDLRRIIHYHQRSNWIDLLASSVLEPGKNFTVPVPETRDFEKILPQKLSQIFSSWKLDSNYHSYYIFIIWKTELFNCRSYRMKDSENYQTGKENPVPAAKILRFPPEPGIFFQFRLRAKWPGSGGSGSTTLLHQHYKYVIWIKILIKFS